mmetsp:Transcript_1053/g.1492  ORF Transcript_1053/g.1492 Transcript_1053/m.1492 type:complete len:115 (+) Transcript_1053:61-405(+)
MMYISYNSIKGHLEMNMALRLKLEHIFLFNISLGLIFPRFQLLCSDPILRYHVDDGTPTSETITIYSSKQRLRYGLEEFIGTHVWLPKGFADTIQLIGSCTRYHKVLCENWSSD